MEYPVGTVKGPFICGIGNNSKGGIQYAVCGRSGWVYFIRRRQDWRIAETEAKAYARTLVGA